MKQVNLNIEQVVHQVAINKLSQEDYLGLIKQHKNRVVKVFLARFKNTRMKEIVKDRKGRDIEVNMPFISLVKNKHNVSWSTAKQAILNLENN